MCFSASASLAAGTLIGVAGVMSARQVTAKRQIMFAAIPVIFALQQFVESFVWLSFEHGQFNNFRHVFVLTFLSLAQILWPIWLPLSLLMIEDRHYNRKILKIIVILSCVLGPFQAYRLYFLPADAFVDHHHIHYVLDSSIPLLGLVLNVLYFISTIIPPFASSKQRVRLLGVFNLVSFAVTVIFFRENVISVWCFFAALISGQVFLAMRHLNRPLKDNPS